MDAFNLINRIETLVESSGRVPLTRKVMIEDQALFEVIDQLRVSIPNDLKMAEEILQQRDEILAQSRAESQRIIDDAHRRAAEKLEMSDSVQLAKQRADELVHEAEQQSQELLQLVEQQTRRQRREVDDYGLDVLHSIDSRLLELTSQVRRGINAIEARKTAGPKDAGDEAPTP